MDKLVFLPKKKSAPSRMLNASLDMKSTNCGQLMSSSEAILFSFCIFLIGFVLGYGLAK